MTRTLEVSLKALVDKIAAESGYGGLDSSTMYGQFALDVARAAVANERERAARVCENGSTADWGFVETTDDLREALAAAIRRGE